MVARPGTPRWPTSLAYLEDLPACEPELDRSVVAEGVEDVRTLERLVDLGVDVAQGHHHSRPVPAAELARWAAQQRDLSGAGAGAGR